VVSEVEGTIVVVGACEGISIEVERESESEREMEKERGEA